MVMIFPIIKFYLPKSNTGHSVFPVFFSNLHEKRIGFCIYIQCDNMLVIICHKLRMLSIIQKLQCSCYLKDYLLSPTAQWQSRPRIATIYLLSKTHIDLSNIFDSDRQYNSIGNRFYCFTEFKRSLCGIKSWTNLWKTALYQYIDGGLKLLI